MKVLQALGKKYIKSYSPKIPLQGVKTHGTPKIPLQGVKAHGTPKIPLQGVSGARLMCLWFLGGQSDPAVFVLQRLGVVVVLGQHARALPVDALVVV